MPFTVDQFLHVFATYNNGVWPTQVLLILLALLAVYFTMKNPHRFIALVLAFFWIWIGAVYHLMYFTTINPAAYAFGVLNIIQGGLFFYYGFMKPQLSFRFQSNLYGYTGAILILYSLLIYPILGYTLGHVYPQSPTFGLPCPTTIFTFGMLLLTDKHVPIPILIIPLIWSFIGFTAALNLGIIEDTGLLVTGLATTLLLVIRNRATSKAELSHAA
jgi:hypothetical protein